MSVSGANTRTLVLLIHSVESMEESHVSGVLYDRRGLWYYVTHDVPQGGYSSFFYSLDALKSGS